MTDIRFIKGDARHLPIEDESIQCIVTSPPYWGLRKYTGEQEVDWSDGRFAYGLEPTIEMYVAHTVEVLREMKRVLRRDGVLFWNIGDSYASGAYSVRTRETPETGKERRLPRNWYADANKISRNGNAMASGCKPKDLCLVPERVAIAAQADGWWVRSMIIWSKRTPMPESCKDRPTNSYEYIVMLTKSERYYWDFEACQEPTTGNSHSRGDGLNPKARAKVNIPSGWEHSEKPHTAIASKGKRDPARYRNKQNESFSAAVCEVVESRNMRNVWTFSSQPYPEAHFATFPEELPRRCIRAATRIGDTVLDPFAGSGTVGRVAIELNRKAILNDLAYHELSEKRTRNVQRSLI